MIKVKVTTQHPNWPLIRQTPRSLGIIDECHFIINQDIEECDYWFVLDGLLKSESTKCPRQNIILVTWEPPTIKSYNKNFINQFDLVITCQKEIKHKNIVYSHQAHPWFVGKTYDELKLPQKSHKDKIISIITSDKIFTEGHQKRYEFALKLKNHFGESIDLYGRGIRDFEDKWEVLAPYRYSIAIENLAYENWLTEKLPDCFLAETYPFYYGCPNVGNYFSKDSFTKIDIEDFDNSIQIIEKIISDENHYDKYYKNIIESKLKYLDQESLFPLLRSFIDKENISNKKKLTKPKIVTIHPEDRFNKPSIKTQIKAKVKSLKSRLFKNKI